MVTSVRRAGSLPALLNFGLPVCQLVALQQSTRAEIIHAPLTGKTWGECYLFFCVLDYLIYMWQHVTSSCVLQRTTEAAPPLAFLLKSKLNGCACIFHRGNQEEGKLERSLDIECPEGKSMKIIARVLGLTKCIVTIGAQTELTAVSCTNEGSGTTRDVKVDMGRHRYRIHAGHRRRPRQMLKRHLRTGECKGVATVIGENAKTNRLVFGSNSLVANRHVWLGTYVKGREWIPALGFQHEHVGLRGAPIDAFENRAKSFLQGISALRIYEKGRRMQTNQKFLIHGS